MMFNIGIAESLKFIQSTDLLKIKSLDINSLPATIVVVSNSPTLLSTVCLDFYSPIFVQIEIEIKLRMK